MLTKREREVALLVAEGKTNKEIADILCISFHTVKAHIGNIYEKMKVDSRVGLAIELLREGMLVDKSHDNQTE